MNTPTIDTRLAALYKKRRARKLDVLPPAEAEGKR